MSSINTGHIDLMKKINAMYDDAGKPEEKFNIIEETDKLPINVEDYLTDIQKKQIFASTVENAYRQACLKFNINYFTSLLQSDKFDDLIVSLKNAKETLSEIEDNKTFDMTEMLFLTINPDVSMISLKDFVKRTGKLVDKKWITHYLYSFEQRGLKDDELGKGFHCHLLIFIDPKKKWSEAKRELQSKYTDVMDTKKWNCFNYKNVKSQQAYDNFFNYVTNVKKSEEKQEKQEYDVKWREANGLKRIYTNSPDFFSNYKVSE